MAIRTFKDREGLEWNVWLVRPFLGEESPLQNRFKEGWICFQRKDGSERCRLTLDEVPPGWESLPDDRLDLLRRVAAQPVNARADTGSFRNAGDTEVIRHPQREDLARGAP